MLLDEQLFKMLFCCDNKQQEEVTLELVKPACLSPAFWMKHEELFDILGRCAYLTSLSTMERSMLQSCLQVIFTAGAHCL